MSQIEPNKESQQDGHNAAVGDEKLSLPKKTDCLVWLELTREQQQVINKVV